MIPWHFHSAVTDWYFVLDAALSIETRAPHRQPVGPTPAFCSCRASAPTIFSESAANFALRLPLKTLGEIAYRQKFHTVGATLSKSRIGRLMTNSPRSGEFKHLSLARLMNRTGQTRITASGKSDPECGSLVFPSQPSRQGFAAARLP
jgi:hypothetical protein